MIGPIHLLNALVDSDGELCITVIKKNGVDDSKK